MMTEKQSRPRTRYAKDVDVWTDVDPFDIHTWPPVGVRCFVRLESGLCAYMAMVRYGYMSFLLRSWQHLPPVAMAQVRGWKVAPVETTGALYDHANETANVGDF